jgi:penicillin-binding protein A
MNTKVFRVAIALAVLIGALVVNLSVVQVIDARDIREKPGNRRLVLEEYSRQRGPILVDGSPIARSVGTADDLRFLREYDNGPLYAAATGFYSLIYGATGLERTENAVLSGTDDRLLVDRIKQLFADAQPRGGAVSLTLNPAAQRAAFEGLAGRTGAVVAIEPATGRILALVTSPAFDPNRLASQSAAAVLAAQEEYEQNADKPLLNRPLTTTLPPGSVFKLITAAAALENGTVTTDTQIPGPRVLDLPQTSRDMRNWNDAACSPTGTVTLERALAISCNTAFAWLGMELGADRLRDQARAFGFDSSFAVPLRSATSRFPEQPDVPQTALSAIGQFDVRATALQMAMVVAALGHGGLVMQPYLVDQVLAPNLTVLDETRPREIRRAVSRRTADAIVRMMVAVVESGTGGNARISGVSVGGKTGTAQNAPDSPPHAWFVGLAPAGNPRIAVAVVLENGGGATEVSGNRLAAPIAREVMRAVLGGG